MSQFKGVKSRFQTDFVWDFNDLNWVLFLQFTREPDNDDIRMWKDN